MAKRGRKPLPPNQKRKQIQTHLTPITIEAAKREASFLGLKPGTFYARAIEAYVRTRIRARKLEEYLP